MSRTSSKTPFKLRIVFEGRDPISLWLEELHEEAKYYFDHVLGVPLFHNEADVFQLCLLRNHIAENGFSTPEFRKALKYQGRVKSVHIWDSEEDSEVEHVEWGIPLIPKKLTIPLESSSSSSSTGSASSKTDKDDETAKSNNSKAKTSLSSKQASSSVFWERRYTPMFQHLTSNVDRLEEKNQQYAQVFFALRRLVVIMDQIWNNWRSNTTKEEQAKMTDEQVNRMVMKQAIEHELKCFQFEGPRPLTSFSADVLNQCMTMTHAEIKKQADTPSKVQVETKFCLPTELSDIVHLAHKKQEKPLTDTYKRSLQVVEFFTEVIRQYIQTATNEQIRQASKE